MKKETSYFSVSPIRVFLCSFFSVGIYDIYWAYKNWDAIKQQKKERISPILRSWFFDLIFIGPLLLRINKSIKSTQKKSRILSIAGYLTFFYLQSFFNIVLYTSANTVESRISIQILCLILLLCSALCLIPVQFAINKHNKLINKKANPTKSFHKGELAATGAGLFMLIFSILSGYVSIENLKQKKGYIYQENMGEILDVSYRHIIGYDKICKKYGYSLQRYPIVFFDKFEPQLQALSDKLININVTIPQAWDLIDRVSKNFIHSIIELELQNMRRGLIISSISDVMDIPHKEIVWDDEYYRILSTAEVCQILDNNAEFLIKTNNKIHESMEFK